MVLQRPGINLQFCWLPAPFGVYGNEKADKAAKGALKLNDDLMKALFRKGEAKELLRKAVRALWQMKWNTDVKGRHYSVQNSNNMKAFTVKCRREDMII